MPALVTIGLIGVLMLAASGKRLVPAPEGGDPFELWRDRFGVAREMKLVGLRNDLDGRRVEFVTRDGHSVVQPMADLQKADQERAWDAAFALKPALTFREARTIAFDPPKTPNPKYRVEYHFDVSVLTIDRVEEGSLRINRVPIEGLHGMTLPPSAWETRVSAGSHDFSSLSPAMGRLQLVTSGLFWAPSIKGALAQGTLRAVCLGEPDEETVTVKVPPRGESTSVQAGPVRLTVKNVAQRRLHLEVKDDPHGTLSYAGFLQETRVVNARIIDAPAVGSEVEVIVGYHRRVKVVEVPFSGTAR